MTQIFGFRDELDSLLSEEVFLRREAEERDWIRRDSHDDYNSQIELADQLTESDWPTEEFHQRRQHQQAIEPPSWTASERKLIFDAKSRENQRYKVTIKDGVRTEVQINLTPMLGRNTLKRVPPHVLDFVSELTINMSIDERLRFYRQITTNLPQRKCWALPNSITPAQFFQQIRPFLTRNRYRFFADLTKAEKKQLIIRSSSLNGSNGEATGSDDVAGPGVAAVEVAAPVVTSVVLQLLGGAIRRTAIARINSERDIIRADPEMMDCIFKLGQAEIHVAISRTATISDALQILRLDMPNLFVRLSCGDLHDISYAEYCESCLGDAPYILIVPVGVGGSAKPINFNNLIASLSKDGSISGTNLEFLSQVVAGLALSGQALEFDDSSSSAGTTHTSTGAGGEFGKVGGPEVDESYSVVSPPTTSSRYPAWLAEAEGRGSVAHIIGHKHGDHTRFSVQYEEGQTIGKIVQTIQELKENFLVVLRHPPRESYAYPGVKITLDASGIGGKGKNNHSNKMSGKKILNIAKKSFIANPTVEAAAANAVGTILGRISRPASQGGKKRGNGGGKQGGSSNKSGQALTNAPKLSMCSTLLAAAIADPHNPAFRGILCNPASDNGNSTLKIGTLPITVNATVGGGGYAHFFVVGCLGNTGICGYYSSTNFSGTTDALVLSANNTLHTGINRVYNTNLPFTLAQLAAGATNGSQSVNGRLVLQSVRVKGLVPPAGSDTIQGEVYTCLSPDHTNISITPGSSSTVAYTTLMSMQGTTRHNLTKNWTTLPVYPVQDLENSAQTSSLSGSGYPFSRQEDYITGYTDAINGVLVGCPVAAIVIVAPAGTQVTYEIVAHCEFWGSGVSYGTTPVTSDPQGMAKVINAAQMVRKQAKGFNWANMTKALASGAKLVAEHVVPMAIDKVIEMTL